MNDIIILEMNIRDFFYNIIIAAKKILQQISYDAQKMDSVFEDHYLLEFYYLYPNVSSGTFAAKTNIPQIKIDQYITEKYGLDFFQLSNKFRIEHFLGKNALVVSVENLDISSLKGSGFTNLVEFKNAFSIYAPISLN